MVALLIVLDSLGIGAAPDAGDYGDEGSATLRHIAEAVGGLDLPCLQSLGLGNAAAAVPDSPPIPSLPPAACPQADYGIMRELSAGKDTTTGHWEIAGLHMAEPFHVFPPGPPSFPDKLVRAFEERTGRPMIGNCAISGTKVIEDLGAQQMADGCWIVYTSADSVFQVAAHEEVIPLEELYSACRIARELCDEYKVGRVIARPYVGAPGSFVRTPNRRDFSYPLPGPVIMDHLQQHGVPSTSIGKIDDIFPGDRFANVLHSETNEDSRRDLADLMASGTAEGLIFVNFIDFDMLYGHRRDPAGYARELVTTDTYIEFLISRMRPWDLLVITADHGNDPTFRGTDHTREYVPLLAYQPRWRKGRPLGIRDGFYDVAQGLADFFEIPRMPRGESILAGRVTK